MEIVILGGELGVETDSEIANGASFGPWAAPGAQGIDAMGNITNHIVVDVARVNTMHAPVTAVQITRVGRRMTREWAR